MKKKNLIVIPANDKSLHFHWLKYNQRSYDIFIIDYTSDAKLKGGEQEYYLHSKGPKWKLIAEAVESLGEQIKAYDYVFMPDDDLHIRADHLNMMFEMASQLDLDIGQPTLTSNSFMDLNITVHTLLLKYRRTSFVEVMMPFFKSQHVYDYLGYFKDAEAGWWLENLWYRDWKEKGLRLGMLDRITATHIRTFNAPPRKSLGLETKGMYAEMKQDPWEERDLMLKKYNLPQHKAKTLSSYTLCNVRVPNLYGRWVRKAVKKAKFAKPENQ